MMASNIATAEAGGYPEPLNDDRWIAKYSNWLATFGALALAFVGVCGIVFNVITLSPINVVVCVLQVVAALIILAIEGSSFVAFLTFAKPLGLFFSGRPLYVKTGVYFGITCLLMLFSLNSSAVLLGFIISACITGLYGVILLGKKASMDEMAAASVDQPKI